MPKRPVSRSSAQEPPVGRSYRQYCAVARALDLVGERWTLLIVRDLLTGPKRYTDLLAGLPGIGTNLLAARLRELEEAQILQRRVLPPPAASTVYELTEVGQDLEPALMALGRWGRRLLDTPREGEFLSPNAYVLAMRAAFRPEAAADLKQIYVLRVGKQVFEVRVANRRCTTREALPGSFDAAFSLDVQTLSALLHGDLSPADAIRTDRIQIQGDPTTLSTFVRLFAIPRS